MHDDELLRPFQAAPIIGVDMSTLSRWIKANRIPYQVVAGYVLIPRDVAEALGLLVRMYRNPHDWVAVYRRYKDTLSKSS